MIAAAPHFNSQIGENRDLEYLLLGDLRQILEEPAGTQTSRWLIAILDMILVSHPHVRQTVYLPVTSSNERSVRLDLETISLMEKLRRLRDRVAHRTGHVVLANELREQLRDYMSERYGNQVAAALEI